MGLDIYVFRLRKATDADKNNKNYIRLTDNNGEYNDRGFPDWALKLKTDHIEQWYYWDLYEKQTGINVKDLEWVSFGANQDGICVWKYDDKNGNVIEIPEASVPLYDKKVFIIGEEEIGYQRKGFNDKFYEDYRAGKIGYYVWSKKELERYKEDYCEDIVTYPNGDTFDYKKYFQEHIIDKFVEGECYACFDW